MNSLNECKYALKSIYDYLDSVENYLMIQGMISQKKGLKEYFRADLLEFLLYLSVSDGKISGEETSFINSLIGLQESGQRYLKYIEDKNLYSVEFENTVPTSIKITYKFDLTRMSFSDFDKDSFQAVTPLVVQFLEETGKIFLKCDGSVIQSEEDDLKTYIKTITDYVTNDLKGKTDTGNKSQEPVIYKGGKKGAIQTPKSVIVTQEKESAISTEENRAVLKVDEYLKAGPIAYTRLIRKLEEDGINRDIAIKTVNNCGADWKEQALMKAQRYLEVTLLSKKELINQLMQDGFTLKEAAFGAMEALKH